MVIGKLERARQEYIKALDEHVTVLKTVRGTADVRAELLEQREYVRTTGRCAYCDGDASDRSTRHVECCRSCGKTLDSMLGIKSKLLNGYDDPALIQPMIDGYAQFKRHVPYALRGATGDPADVVKGLEAVKDAAAHYRLEKKAAAAREAAINIEQKRKREIRALVLKVHPDIDQETLEEKVNEYYALEEVRQYEKTSH